MIGFVDVRAGVHTNPFESTWQHIKAFLNLCYRMWDYICHLAHFVFAAGCLSENVYQFTKFIGDVASMAWIILDYL
jgi:hypothetical protein